MSITSHMTINEAKDHVRHLLGCPGNPNIVGVGITRKPLPDGVLTVLVLYSDDGTSVAGLPDTVDAHPVVCLVSEKPMPFFLENVTLMSEADAALKRMSASATIPLAEWAATLATSMVFQPACTPDSSTQQPVLCSYCHKPVQPVHGHYACHTSGCGLFGLNVDPCCGGSAEPE